jgi:hypothetical protein
LNRGRDSRLPCCLYILDYLSLACIMTCDVMGYSEQSKLYDGAGAAATATFGPPISTLTVGTGVLGKAPTDPSSAYCSADSARSHLASAFITGWCVRAGILAAALFSCLRSY